MSDPALDVRVARRVDLAVYVAQARRAQARLMAKGLAQYVPAAHPEYDAYLRARVADGTLLAVWDAGRPVAFFVLESARSRWWPADDIAALYLAGMVVAPELSGRGLGAAIVEWCAAEAGRRHKGALRIDCHAGNPWLCAWYEARGFALRGRVEQQPGYDGCLYERMLAAPA